MSEFDRTEWEEENNKKPGENWITFTGNCRPEFCDIRLKTGKEVGPCWKAREDFVDLSSDNEDRIPHRLVSHVKYYEAAEEEDRRSSREDQNIEPD